MPISTRENDGRAYFEVTGLANAEEIMMAVDAFYVSHGTKHAVLDFRGASLSSLSPAVFKDLARCCARYAGKRGSGAKTAVYVKNRADMLLVKAFDGMVRGETPIVYGAFTDLEELDAWLSS